MKITKELLKKLEACEDGIAWAERNNLLPFDSDNIKNIKGDFKGYISWLENQLIDITFDKNGNELIYKDSKGFSWKQTFDEKGNVLTHENANGFSWRRMYDKKGNALSHQDSEGDWWKKTYDCKGNVLTYKDSKGYWWLKTYDERGNILIYEDSCGDKDVFEYIRTKDTFIIKKNNKRILEFPLT